MKKIMKFLDVIYYNLYLRYRRHKIYLLSPKDMAWFALSSYLAFMFIGISSVISICVKVIPNSKYNIFIVIIQILTHQYFFRKERYIYILKEKPIIKSKKFSKIITIVFEVFSVFVLYMSIFIIEKMK
ncbi:MAG: hypothetical protein IJA34_15570 [Lachnospiraceae bacterium]|nr:hypothetical protein [Lachnospiraceae bacterium]